MSWGITFTARLNRVRKDQLQALIDEEEEIIKMYERMIISLCSNNATELPCFDDGCKMSKWEYVAVHIPEYMESIMKSAANIALAQQALLADDVKED